MNIFLFFVYYFDSYIPLPFRYLSATFALPLCYLYATFTLSNFKCCDYKMGSEEYQKIHYSQYISYAF